MNSSAPHVVWTHRAEHRLHEFLPRAEGASADRPAHMADIQERLAAAFPQASDLLILDLLFGFRARAGEYVLRLDLRQPERPGTYIVKLADEARLRRECEAWRTCQPPAFQGDRVLMNQEPRYHPGPPPRLVALAYQDAGRHIGTDRQISLEEAFLLSVRFAAVDGESLSNVLRELFARLGSVLYRGACLPETPTAPHIELNLDNKTSRRRRLSESLERWQSSCAAVTIRQEVNAAFPLTFSELLDPVDFFRFVEDETAAGIPAERWQPRLLRGRAHGDLHGRNILVGVREGETSVSWPAVFDYEHMAADNLIGWDFVKLETELKIRAYRHVFGDVPLRHYACQVQAFEQELGEQTEKLRWVSEWPAPGGATPRARLLHLLLRLRQLAGCHLGPEAGRPQDWLEEYYFLLGCYGVSCVWYENQSAHEQIGTFVSAGVAAARYAFSRKRPVT